MDDAAGFFNVFPDAGDESVAADFVAAGAFVLELAFYDPLGSDAGVVGAGEPEGWDAGHAAVADEGVLQCFFEGVAEMEFAGHVGRGHNDGIGGAAGLGDGVEVAVILPFPVDAAFYGGGVISWRHLTGSRHQ